MKNFVRHSRKKDFLCFDFVSLKLRFLNPFSKLTLKTPEQRHWRRSVAFIVNFEQIHIFLRCFCCWSTRQRRVPHITVLAEYFNNIDDVSRYFIKVRPWFLIFLAHPNNLDSIIREWSVAAGSNLNLVIHIILLSWYI